MNIDIVGKLNDWTLFIYKNLFGLFSRIVLDYFEFQCQILLRLYHNTYTFLFCIDLFTYKTVSGFMI